MLFSVTLASFPPLIQGTRGLGCLLNTDANSLLPDSKFNFSSSPQEVTAEEWPSVGPEPLSQGSGGHALRCWPRLLYSLRGELCLGLDFSSSSSQAHVGDPGAKKLPDSLTH